MMDTVQLVALGERLALGTFFTISGYHKIFNPDVQARMAGLFGRLGVPWALRPVTLGELAGGLGLIAGCFTPFASAGLMLILGGAIYLDVWQADIAGKHPRDPADWIAKTLYCPEVLMFWMLASVILLGPGPFAIDNLWR